jgi:lipid-binding SYLF domain-containing protein
MKPITHILFAILISIAAFQPTRAMAASAAEIESESRAALKTLYKSNSKAGTIGEKARAILVFPSVKKGGFVFSGQHGEGALFKGKAVSGYYSTIAASFGLEAGVQKFSYALFFMNDGALKHLNSKRGWEVGGTPNLVIVDQGVAKNLSTTELKDIYVFVYGQKGLMGGVSLQGSKITRIYPK